MLPRIGDDIVLRKPAEEDMSGIEWRVGRRRWRCEGWGLEDAEKEKVAGIGGVKKRKVGKVVGG